MQDDAWRLLRGADLRREGSMIFGGGIVGLVVVILIVLFLTGNL